MKNYKNKLIISFIWAAISATVVFLAALVFFYIATSKISTNETYLLAASFVFAFCLLFERLILFVSIILLIICCFIKKRRNVLGFLATLIIFWLTIRGLSLIYSPSYSLKKGAIKGVENIDTTLIKDWAVESFESSDFPKNEDYYVMGDYPDWAKKYYVQYLIIYNFDKYRAVEINYGNRAVGSYSYYIMIGDSQFDTAFPHLINHSHKISDGCYLVCQFGLF